MLARIERQIKQRFAIGQQVDESVIINDLVRQNYAAVNVQKVLMAMIRHGELQHKFQRRTLFRVR